MTAGDGFHRAPLDLSELALRIDEAMGPTSVERHASQARAVRQPAPGLCRVTLTP
jgi:hypothetical protein